MSPLQGPLDCWKEPQEILELKAKYLANSSQELALQIAEYCNALAVSEHRICQDRCVDFYYQAAAFSWHALEMLDTSGSQSVRQSRAWQLYHSSLGGLITSGQQFGRLDGRRGILVNSARGTFLVETSYYGFTWESEDFNRLIVVRDYELGEISHRYTRCGLGVPLVVVRQRKPGCYEGTPEQFLDPVHPFAATVVLRPDLRPLLAINGNDAAKAASSNSKLELYDSVQIRQVRLMSTHCLAADLTAPLAVLRELHDDDEASIGGFLDPESQSDEAGLFMLEPYRPGKIPVVFVHGLLSSPLAWIDIANQFRADPEIISHYQLWGFQYPTGDPFLGSAGDLRNDLRMAWIVTNPQDEALSQMVLVGHSMGGLIAQLQVTTSEHKLWNQVFLVPFEQVPVSGEERERLRNNLFFEPLPFVRRVVFIGVPHQGASAASGATGKLIASLVTPRPESEALHRLLTSVEPPILTRPFRKRFPTSVDLLSQRSPLLDAMQEMEFGEGVHLHSIIGTRPSRLWSISDGVVTVRSAMLPEAESATFVPASHIELPNHPASAAELKRLLREHHAVYCPATEVADPSPVPLP